MPLKTIANSTLICDKGSETVLLQVTSQNHSKINGELIATEMDKKIPENISSFGSCGLLRSSCKCKPTVWQKTLKSRINKNAKLSIDSFMLCDIGGKIEFKNSGANNFSKSESSKSANIDSLKEKNDESLEKAMTNDTIIIAVLLILVFVSVSLILALV